MKQAVHHWWFQRLTAVILAPLCLWFIFSLACMSGLDHASVHSWIKSPLQSLLLILFSLAIFYHAHLGLQVVIEDYVGNNSLRNTCIYLSMFIMLFAGLVSIMAVLKIVLDL